MADRDAADQPTPDQPTPDQPTPNPSAPDPSAPEVAAPEVAAAEVAESEVLADGSGDPPATPATAPPRRRWSRRRRVLTGVVVVVLGLGIAGAGVATNFVESVRTPEQIELAEGTTIYYSDGRTVLARLGSTRDLIDTNVLPPYVRFAVMAAEDPTFLTSTRPGGITYQYARLASGDDNESAVARLRRQVMAQKLDDKYSKAEILGFYLNTIYFGRGAYGIEAATRAYFGAGRTAKALTIEEAMVLAGLIKSPGDGAFDPAVNPGPARERWDAIKTELVDMMQLTRAEAAAMEYPSLVPYDPNNPPVNEDMSRPTGHVVAQVLSELKQTPLFKDRSWTEIMNGGYRIVTTIDSGIQKALEHAVSPTPAGSLMHGQLSYLQAAGVVVQPGTGRVLAYYGGDDGTRADYAGWHYDENGVAAGFGAHPAGQTFFVYGLAAALKGGVSVKSYWNAKSPTKFPDGFTISNVGGHATCKACTLVQSAVSSLNVPFYGLTYTLGPANVMQMARDAGVDYIWTDMGERVDLRNTEMIDVMQKYYFDSHIGIGQYSVTVLDQANAMATFAAGGLRAQAHFVVKVIDPRTDKSQVIYSEKLPTDRVQPILNRAQIADLTWALSQNKPARLAGGPASAGMVGTWESGRDGKETSHAWMVGYTRKVAMAVWVGPKGTVRPLRDRDGNKIFGSGLPASIYRTVMTAASVGAPGEPFDPPRFIGDPKAGNTPPPK